MCSYFYYQVCQTGPLSTTTNAIKDNTCAIKDLLIISPHLKQNLAIEVHKKDEQAEEKFL